MIVLEAGEARAKIAPEAGGRVASLSVHGLELLVTDGPTPRRWGAFPMAPYAGRVRDGRFEFEGVSHDLPIVNPPHAIHGTVYDQAWKDEGDGVISVELGPAWPFRGTAVHRFVLEPDSLRLQLEVHAEGGKMPASCGWHPWWRRQLDRGGPAELSLDAQWMYARDEAGIPSGELVAPPPGPWDECFTGLRQPPRLLWPDALELTIESSCQQFVVFDQLPHAICVEPQTGPPDALNLDPFIVEPDKPLIAWTLWRWRLL